MSTNAVDVIQIILLVAGLSLMVSMRNLLKNAMAPGKRVSVAEKPQDINMKDLFFLKMVYKRLGRIVVAKITVLIVIAVTLFFQWNALFFIAAVGYAVFLYIYLKLSVNKCRRNVETLIGQVSAAKG
ncbi:MAG: hypothetical protein Q7S53_00565 [bacterium]|nr:hypothetical protein [bacterium]